MKKVTMKETSYNMLKGKILESKFNDINSINEISYGTVDKAYDKLEKIFGDMKSYFEDFYTSLNDAIFKVKHESSEGEAKQNPYLDKIKYYADRIDEVLRQKEKQRENFYDNTMRKFDYNKFYDDNEKPQEWEDNYDNLDLRMLQQKYPKS